MRFFHHVTVVFGFLTLFACGPGPQIEDSTRGSLEEEYQANSFRAVSRDSFPVLTNPPMDTSEKGDRILHPNEWVIGIALKGEAKAYPVDVMGFHELINDTVGRIPIAVGW